MRECVDCVYGSLRGRKSERFISQTFFSSAFRQIVRRDVRRLAVEQLSPKFLQVNVVLPLRMRGSERFEIILKISRYAASSQLHDKRARIPQVQLGRVPGVTRYPDERCRLFDILRYSGYTIRVPRGAEQDDDRNPGPSPLLHQPPYDVHVVLPLGQPSDGHDMVRAYPAVSRKRVERLDPARAVDSFGVHGEHVRPAVAETNVHHRLGLKGVRWYCPQEIAVDIPFA